MAASKGSKGTFGFWGLLVKGIKTDPEKNDFTAGNTASDSAFLSKKSYQIDCYFKTSGMENPEKNIRIKINWLDNKGGNIFTEFVSRYRKEGEWYHAEQKLTAPRNTANLSLELILQWSDSGTVWWDDVSVREVQPDNRRKIKVAASNDKPLKPSTTEKNLKFYSYKITAAGKLGVDLLCLGEGITLVSTGRNFEQVAESIPGESTKILGEAARKSNMYVVAGIYEREGPLIYNTAILIDRQGNIAGKYRKTHLPQTEIEGGLTPGSEYPVFRTDFGIIGIEICYDNFFPEVSRSLALNGAEIIILPIWGDIRGDFYEWDIVARARAIDNAVYLVASMYDGPDKSLIIDPDGKILPDADGFKGLKTATIDPSKRTFERWLSVNGYGEWKNLFPQERRSETYK